MLFSLLQLILMNIHQDCGRYVFVVDIQMVNIRNSPYDSWSLGKGFASLMLEAYDYKCMLNKESLGFSST